MKKSNIIVGVLFVLCFVGIGYLGYSNYNLNKICKNTTNVVNTSSSTKASTTVVSDDIYNYLGVWQNDLIANTSASSGTYQDPIIPNYEVNIKRVDGKKITFNYDVYRSPSWLDISATLDSNNSGEFTSTNTYGTFAGTITLKSDTVILNVKKAGSDTTNIGSRTFTIKATKSILE